MYLDYPTFATLLCEANDYQDIDMYIAERGWQKWMDPFDPDDISEILNLIYRMARMSIREIRTEAGYSREGLAREYHITCRTIQCWEYGEHTAPEHVRLLIYYTFFLSLMNKEGRNDSSEQD